MKRVKVFLTAVLAAVLVMGSITPVYAYFTANAEARGGLPIKSIDTNPKEKVLDGQKQLTVENSENGTPVYVRARAFSGDASAALTYTAEVGWTDGGDGWWYYTNILNSSESTTVLTADISKVIPEDAKVGDNFNVVVVYESVAPMANIEGAQATFQAYEAQEGGNQ